VVVAAFILLRISENGRIKGDAAVAMISTTALALGVMAVSMKEGTNIDLDSYLFGSILALTDSDVTVSVILSICVTVLFVLFYNLIFSVTFDESFAAATGVRTGIYNMLIAVLTAVTVVLGMRLMGTLLISALMIFPALSSMRIFKSFKAVTVSSAIISVMCFLFGIVISFICSAPPGASVVLVNVSVFILFAIIGWMKARRK